MQAKIHVFNQYHSLDTKLLKRVLHRHFMTTNTELLFLTPERIGIFT